MSEPTEHKWARPDFGLWFSGFFDGEGHFGAVRRTKDRSIITSLQIGIRDDDYATLERIQGHFGCGKLHAGEKDKLRWSIQNVDDLYNVVIPFFEMFPLYTKKRQEFLLWKELVRELYLQKQARVVDPERRSRMNGALDSLRKIRGYYEKGFRKKFESRAELRARRAKQENAEKAKKILRSADSPSSPHPNLVASQPPPQAQGPAHQVTQVDAC